MPEPTEKYTLNDLKSLKSVSLATPITPSPGMVASESKYDTEFIVPEDAAKQQQALEYFKGERQPRIDKWANAVPRLVSKVGTEIAKTPGYLYALGEAGLTDTTLAESLNNAWLNTLDNLDQKTKEEFAIYTPKSVKEGNLWDNLTSASFYTNEGVDGLGYLVAAMLPGAALKTAGLAGKTASLAGKLGANAGKAASIGSKVELGTATLMNSTLEALGETKGLVDNLKSQFEIKLEKGEINPNTGLPWTKEEADLAINEAGKGVFMNNMALLLAPNYIMNKNLLGRFVPTKNTLSKVIDPVTGAFKEASQLTKKELLGDVAKELGTGLFSEGFVEEAGQFAIEKYHEKLAKGETKEGLISGLLEEYGNALTTTEGQKAIFLGGAFGSISAIGGVKQAKKEEAYVNKLSKVLKENFDGFSTTLDDLYVKNEDGSIKLDNNNNPVINPKKYGEVVANIALENKSSNLKDIYGMVGNKEAFDYIYNQEFTRFAIPYLQQDGGLDALNKHIDNLSKQLVETKKQQEGIDDSFNEQQYVSQLKQKAKKLQEGYNNITNYVNTIDLGEQSEQASNFINKLTNSTFQELSKQMFLADRIDNLSSEISQLELGTTSTLPQVQHDIKLKQDQLESYKKSLDDSIEAYKELFDKKKINQSFEQFKTEDNKLNEDIAEIETKVQDPNYEENQKQLKYNKLVKDINKASNEKDLDAYLKEADDKGLTNPELIDLISQKRENIKASKTNITKDTTPTDLVLNEKPEVTSEEDSEVIETIYIQPDGKRKTSIYTTESGLDDDSDAGRSRLFRYLEKNKVADKKLLIVTKENNPSLYNEILEDRPEAKEYESKNSNYRGIYTVLVDKTNQPIKIDNKLIYTTLTKNVEHLLDSIQDQGRIEIEEFRNDLLDIKKPNSFLQITGKSKGIPVYEPKIDGKRQSHSVIGRIGNSTNDIKLDLPTQKGYRINNQPVDLGKLYAIDKEGRVFDLLPRLLNTSEIDLVSNLVQQQLGIIPKTIDNPIDEIKKIISLNPKSKEEFRIFFNSNNQLVLGNNVVTEFNPEVLNNFLLNKRVNANSKFNFEESFEPAVTSEEQRYTVKSYKDYLLGGENPMFGTDLVPNTEIQFRNIYVTYDPKVITDKLNSENINKESNVLDDNTAPIVEETKEPTKKKFDKRDKGQALNRLAKPGVKLNQSEINWFKSVLPNVNIEKVQGLIEDQSFGRFLSNGQVLLSSEATEGTLIHEAFHAVTQLYLTEDEINKLYKEASSKYPGLSRQELEEILAEDFVDYKSTGKVLANTPQRNNIFRKLLQFIKDLLGLNASNIEEVYKRLDKGYYSNNPIMGVREFSNLNRNETKYKITSEKGSAFLKDVLDGLDVMFFEEIYNNGKTPIALGANKTIVFNRVYDKFIDKYESTTDPDLIKDYEYILENWDNFTLVWEERLNSQGFKLLESTDLELTEEEELIDAEEDKTERSGETFKDSNLVDPKSTLSNQSRLLIRSLKSGKTNRLGLETPVDFNQTYNFILKNVAGIGSSYVDLYNKLVELSEIKPELKELTTRLKEPSSDLTEEQINFQTQFLQDFNKIRTNSYITIFRNDGTVTVLDSTRMSEVERVKTIWENNSKIVANLQGDKLFIDSSITDIKDNIEFLNELGISLHPKTIEAIKSEDFDSREFNQSVTAIRNYITENKNNITKLFDFGEDIGGRMKYLLTLEAKYTPNVNELSFISAEGKTVYSIGEPNGLGIITNKINNSSSLEELYNSLPHLNTVGAKNSYWLTKLFNPDGSRNKKYNISLDLFDGIQAESKYSTDKSSTRKLELGDLFAQQFNNTLLEGKTSYIVSADKSSEFALSIGELPISIDTFKDGFDSIKLNLIFKNYFKSEYERVARFYLDNLGKDIDVYNKNGGKFTIFEFLPKKLKDKALDKFDELSKQGLDYNSSLEELNKTLHEILAEFDIAKFFDNKFKEAKNKLTDLKVLEYGIAKELIDKYSEDQLIRAFIVNDMINSIEQIKLFIGDMAFYKDLYKRIAGNAGTKQIPRTDEVYNEYLNKDNKRLDKKLADSKINVVVFNDVKTNKEDLKEYIDTLISEGMDESLAEEALKSYKEMDEGDAQGWITLDEYREFLKRLGQWTPLQEQAFNKMQNNESLTKNEIALFKVLKAQYFGPQVYNDLFAPAYHKFSLMPLLPQLVKGRNMEKVLNHMTANQIGYALFKSGSKVGTKVNDKGKANNFYTKGNNGEINLGNWQKQQIYYNFLGIQTKTSDPKDKVVFGTQFRKLLWNNVFENGNPKFEGAQELFNEYSKIIENQIKREKDKLIKELGLNTDNYTIEDATKIVELLTKEAKDRNLADNIIDALDIEILEGKKLIKYSVDSMVNKSKIDSMLMSLINSRLIRQKVNGDAYVQGASSGFEKAGERPVGTNPDLKFYRQVDGKTLPMEVMIPMSKNYYPLLNKYKTLDNLNKAIAKGKIDDKALELIGYRIPTQGLNSIEYMTVKEFIPEESATLIILPTEIVAKSGGDYDIDKLNVFRPYLNSKGEFITSKTDEEIGNIYDKLVNKEIEKIIGPSDASVDKLLGDIFGEDLTLTSEDIKEIITEAGLPSKEDFIKNFNRVKSNQNQIIEISKKVLSNKFNFGALITPNSNHILVETANDIKYQKHINDKIRKEEKPMPKDKYIESLEQKANIGYTAQLDVVKKIQARYKLWLAKDEVGPAAIANVYHTLSQIADLKLNKTYKIGKEEKQVNINLPHHETKDNKINLSNELDVEGKNKISEIYSQIINIVVDAAKEEEPIVNQLNMTMDTLPVYLYLTKMGVPFEILGKFMTQPIINDYLSEVNKNSALFLDVKGAKLTNKKIVNSVKSNYGKEVEGYIPTQFTLKELNNLQKSENQNSPEFREKQLQILNDFLAYKEQADLFTKVIKSTNFDTAGVGQNIDTSYLKLADIQEVKDINFVEGLENINNSFIGAFNQHEFSIDAYKSLYYTQDPDIINNTLTVYNYIKNSIFKPISAKDSTRILNLIENDLINYIVQNYGYNNLKELKNNIFYINSVAKRLGELKTKVNKTPQEQKFLDNVLIRELYPILRNAEKPIDNIKIFTKRFDSFTANQLTEAFRELKTMDLPFAMEFTKDLMDLGILQSGLNNSPITYLGIIPYEYYNELVKKAFQEFDKKNGAVELFKFNQLFIRNNYKDSNITNLAKSLRLGNVTVKEEGENGKITATMNNGLGYGIYGKDYDITKYDNKLKTIRTEENKEDNLDMSDKTPILGNEDPLTKC